MFLVEKSKIMARRALDNYKRKNFERIFFDELKRIKGNYAGSTLTASDSEEIINYYKSFGFDKINLDWHDYLYRVTGNHDKRYIPENFYHLYIEPHFTDRNLRSWVDKAYMHERLKGVQFPPCIVRNVNGYFLDNDGRFISSDTALKMIKKEDEVIIKPTVGTGGGRKVALFKTKDFTEQVFENYNKNYIVQKRLSQNSEYSVYNSSSVNTEKIISLLYKGKVYILTSILRVGAAGEITDTASTGKGYTIGISDDGILNDYGFTIYGDRVFKDSNGDNFAGRRLSRHQDIAALTKKLHMQLPYFGIVSWDFSVNSDNEIVLIEFNISYPDVLVYQMDNGPLFGDMTDEVLNYVARLEGKI